jgi:phosphohistidine phosphatase
VKTVCLLRHAKSDWSDPTLADFDRPLADRGHDAAIRMGAFMAAERILPGTIVCSAARRALETWERIAASLGQPDARIEPALYMASSTVIIETLHGLPASPGSVLLIGHNPGMEEAALRLSGAGDSKLLGRMGGKFPTCALAVITFDTAEWSAIRERAGRLERFVRPRDL